MKLSKIKLKWQIFGYILGFAAIIIVVFCVFQIFMLESMYKDTKINNIEKLLNQVEQEIVSVDDFDDKEIPAALIVFDHVVTSNPQFKKTYHLHSVNVPEVNGNRTTILRTENGYNGKLVNDTLLPKAENLDIVVPTTDKDEYLVYGNRFYTSQLASGTDEGSAIRTDISPKNANKEDYFLNVMQVSDGNSTEKPLEATLIEASTHTGVKIKDRVVMFGKTKERIFDKVTFGFDGEETYEISIADLKAGTWKVEYELGRNSEITFDIVEEEYSKWIGREDEIKRMILKK